ncbi:AmmeMemoRadiSam system protein B [Marinitoga sp. 38H-ov]|uniref:AmmeMemoRadiSam system protein B n=1 Tax=Marinitoga sp. 38H-ov TaxID=1755814 RepID=UPI0013EAFB0A|nr:AmmeMemoRadiSam system protein B [Marinitoga sp. 38H-ov]KAF2956731.1 extradiol dioxygenase [Marinitoga sp. 38H-ov]
MTRYPVVSGSFYPSDKNELIKILDGFFRDLGERKEEYINPTGIISPHAGYIFSGKTAAYAYSELYKKGNIKRAIIIGPNHTGIGPNISVYPEGTWVTPLGELEIDDKTNELIEKLGISGDFSAHRFEHSIEVQLPFLQYLYGNIFKIIPIILSDQSLETTKNLAKVLNEIIDDGTVIIASSDLNHYENHNITMKKGELIIEAIKEKNSEKLYEYIYKYNISACGYGCINTLLSMNFLKINILNHTTSAEAFGEYERTVGYLSAILEK